MKRNIEESLIIKAHDSKLKLDVGATIDTNVYVHFEKTPRKT